MKITFLGNFGVDFSSESHHVKSLESLGHEVIKLQERNTTSELIFEVASRSDLFVWVHTHGWNTPGVLTMRELLKLLKSRNIPTLTYHLDLWFGIQRQKEMETEDYWNIQHFFTADKNMANWLNKNTPVKGHYLAAGVFDQECYLNQNVNQNKDVVFVGSRGYHPEWQWRPQLVDWLRETYGQRFFHYGGDGIKVVRGHELNMIYAESKVVIGDTLCLNFDYPNYLSDRIFETTGRGGFIIHPYIKGIEDFFEIGKEIVTFKFGDFKDLKSKIDYYVENKKEREEIRRAGSERTKRDHTYLQRWAKILEVINGVPKNN